MIYAAILSYIFYFLQFFSPLLYYHILYGIPWLYMRHPIDAFPILFLLRYYGECLRHFVFMYSILAFTILFISLFMYVIEISLKYFSQVMQKV